MFRCVTVSVLLQLLVSVNTLFDGDKCLADGRKGICRVLAECQSIITIIKNAGKPMPLNLRQKLQKHTCGFQNELAMVCCLSTFDSEDVFILTNRERPRPNSAVDEAGNTSVEASFNDTFTRISTTSTPFPFLPTNKKGAPDDDIDFPVDVRAHRNLHLLPSNCGLYDSDRIFGGNRTNLYESPWMALISYESARGIKLSCGGTLISERYVLTAAHCVTFLGTRLKPLGVILGEHDIRTDPDCEDSEGDIQCAPNAKNFTIESLIPHPGYNPKTLFDDIALLRLSEPADITQDHIKPICLPITPELQKESLEGVNAEVTGWGTTENGLQSPVLLSVKLPVIANKDCQNAYNGSPRIYNRQLCAGGVENKDSCGGDSGGPLTYPGKIGNKGSRFVQRGVVSYGSKRCGIGGLPGVYTRVAYYMEWILDSLRI